MKLADHAACADTLARSRLIDRCLLAAKLYAYDLSAAETARIIRKRIGEEVDSDIMNAVLNQLGFCEEDQ